MSSRRHFFSQTLLCHSRRKGCWEGRREGGRELLIHGGVLLQFVEKNAKTARTVRKLHFQFIYSHHASDALSTATLHQTVKIWRSRLMKSGSTQNVIHLVSIYKLEVELSSSCSLHFSLLGVCRPSAQHPPKFSGILGERVFFVLVSYKFLECCSSAHTYLVCFHPL